MGTYFFKAVWNGVQITCGVSIIQPSLFSLTSYFIVSKRWPISGWDKFYFFPLVNFGSGWTARAKLLLSGLDMTLFTALHMCDVLHHVT